MNFFREIVVALPAELFLLQKHNDKKFVKVQHPINGFLIIWCFFVNRAIFPSSPPEKIAIYLRMYTSGIYVLNPR